MFCLIENYGSVLRDCSKALTINPHSSKAFYRSAVALMALDRVNEALDCCVRCLDFDKENKSIIGVYDRAAKAKEVKDRKDKEKAERLRKEEEARRQMEIAFRVRHTLPKKVEAPNSHLAGTEPHCHSQRRCLIKPLFPTF